MPWGRERGAGVSPLQRGCPATAPPSIMARDAVHPAMPHTVPSSSVSPRRRWLGAWGTGWVLGALAALGQ